MNARRIVVAMTGASGAVIGIHLLKELQLTGIETHLVISRWAESTIKAETSYTLEAVQALAHAVYPVEDLAANISSGSFQTNGMVIVPCSMKTVAAVACGFSHNLIARAADVTLKEGRKLILMPRETPLSAIHLHNMLTLAHMGAVILPPCVGFYTMPETIEDVVNHLVGKVMDTLQIDNKLFTRWTGMP